MSQEKYSIKKPRYTHLKAEQRAQIEVLHKEKYTQAEIARLTGVSQSTVSRELLRNSIEQMDSELRTYRAYYADTAQLLYKKRQRRSGARYKYMSYPSVIERIERDVLEKRWSPEASIGRMERETGELAGITARTFYNYVEAGLVRVKPIDLLLKLRRRNKVQRIKAKRREIGKSIDERPPSVQDREEFGHWEIDGVIGMATDRTELLTIVERKSRNAIVMKLEGRTQEAVEKAFNIMERKFGRAFPHVFKTITSDNGSEFLDYAAMERSHYKNRRKRTEIYFAHPYRASERGSNENGNGILRRFIPKGLSIDTLCEDRIRYVAEWMNALPRKVLGYRTASEVFEDEMATILGNMHP